MNRSAQIALLLDTARSTLRRGLASTIAQCHCAIVLVLLLVTVGFPPNASAQKAGSSKSGRSALGTLKIWVPAGMVGANYWIYLNGHIVSAPRGTADPGSQSFITVATGKIGSDGRRETKDGWEIWTAEGLVLKMLHENYDSRLTSYLNSGPGDTLHFFQTFDLRLHPNKYTVEVAILSRGGPSGSPYSMSPLPFVITQKYVGDVRPGQITQLYTGVPDDWSDTRLAQALLADRVCPKGPAPPDADQLQRWVKEYMDDPMVKILRGVDTSTPSRPKGGVVLNLPPTQGGPREFDGNQIGYIADSISVRHNLPSHSEVAACQSRFPQFSQSYAEYDKMISLIDSDMESFRKLAATLIASGGR